MQGILRQIGRNSLGFRIANSLSDPNRIFPSFEQAWSAARRKADDAHDNRQLVTTNLGLSSSTRPSDYPALFWLDRIGRDGLKIFDYGGGAGQLFYQYSGLLRQGSIGEWIVMDLPQVVAIGKEFAAQRDASALRFSTSLADSSGCDVFLASGSLHYWELSIRELAEQMGGLPEHVVINRSPFRENGEPFFSIQHGAGWAIPFVCRSAAATRREFEALGYEQVDRWRVMEKSLSLALLPGYESPYLGFYFRRHRG